MRKGRNAGVGDRDPSLGSSSGCLASLPHTAGQARCWGPGDMKVIQHGSSAQLHLWARSRSSLRRLSLTAEDAFCSNTLLAQLFVVIVISLRHGIR